MSTGCLSSIIKYVILDPRSQFPRTKTYGYSKQVNNASFGATFFKYRSRLGTRPAPMTLPFCFSVATASSHRSEYHRAIR